MIEVAVDDFTVKVSGTTTLAELDEALSHYEQITTLYAPSDYSINQILLENWGYNCQQAVLGLGIEHKGTKSKCGGQVIKNVSGYDLAKLYIGSCGDYGSITSVYLRTTKLAEHELIYNCPQALWQLDLSHWRDGSIEISNVIASAAKQSTTIRLWGESELLNLRATKLEKLLKDFTKEETKYQKQYLSKKTRVELNTSPSSLKYLFELLQGETIHSLTALPLNSAINIYCDNPSSILDKIKSQNHLYSALIYPRDRALEYYYNQAKADEEKLLAKLYAKFN